MNQRKADLLMVSVACVWGFSYILMKLGLGTIQPFQLIFMRFGIAFFLLIVIFRNHAFPRNRQEWTFSAILGTMLFLLFAFLLYGLQTADASTAGFLVGSAVAIVPLLNIFLLKRIPSVKTVCGVTLSIIGIAFLSIKDGLTISISALLCLGGALSYALQVIVTEIALNKKCDSLHIGIFQLGFAALFGLIATLITNSFTFFIAPISWIAVIGLALLCTAYGFVLQTIVQKYTTSERIGIIHSLEPIFSAIFAFSILHETMSVKELIGAALVIIGTLI